MQQLKSESERIISELKTKSFNSKDVGEIILIITNLLQAIYDSLPNDMPYIVKEVLGLLLSIAKMLGKILTK